MKWLAVLGMFCVVFGSRAGAQVQVSAQTERSDFLLYERVDLLVTVVNSTTGPLTLENEPNHPWLSFLVTKHNHLPVRSERAGIFRPLTLRAGQSKILRINLTPLFLFREEGNYNAVAVVDLSGTGDVVSDPVPFNVREGRKVWTQTRPIAGSQRTYSLIRFSPQPDQTDLYLRVEDASENTVFTNLSLGQVTAYVDPDVFFDPQDNVHIMQLSSMNTYLYTRADAEGKIVRQGVFTTFKEVAPRLAKLEDGNVTVVGGQEREPASARETLSEGQGGTAFGSSRPDIGVPPAGPIEPPIALPLPPPTAVVAPAPMESARPIGSDAR